MNLRFTQESDFRQQRDFGQKISATFAFIGAHWRGLGRALLYIVLPAALLQGIANGLMQKQMLTNGMGASKAGGQAAMVASLAKFGNLFNSPLYWVNATVSIVFLTLLILTVYGYVVKCLRATPSGEPIGVGEVWAVVRAQFLSSFLSYFGLSIMVVLGFVFLVIPGIYLLVGLSLFYVIKIVEGTGFSTTVSRSLRLVRGKWWATVGLLFIMAMMVVISLTVIGGFIGGIIGGIGGGMGLYHPGTGGSDVELFTVIISSITGLFNLLIYPPLLIALAFQYFNLVERHEGVGLHNLVNQLGQTPATAQTATYRAEDEGEY